MKANELMIGDLVYGLYPNGKRYASPCCISAVDIYPTNRSPRIVTMGGYGFQSEQLEPIPLTPEILEKNGFMDDGVSWWYRDFHISLSGTKNLTLICGRTIQFSFVHELQHALRLCGIDKTIEL